MRRRHRSFALRFASPFALASVAAVAAFALPRVASAQTVVYAENWDNGTTDWAATSGAVAVATDSGGLCSSQFTRETVPASGGRTFNRHGIPVTAGAAYCLTSWVRGSASTQPF